MITQIPSLSIPALQAVSVFASTDDARPVLTTVAMCDESTFVATDSMRLAIASSIIVHPGDLVAHASELRKAESPLLIPADMVGRFVKARKSVKWPEALGASLDVADDMVRMVAVSEFNFSDLSLVETQAPWVKDRRLDAFYPNFQGLLTEGPSWPADATYSFNPAFLADFHKAGKLLDNHPTLWTFHGGTGCGTAKPTYWATRSGGVTLVVLFMATGATHSVW